MENKKELDMLNLVKSNLTKKRKNGDIEYTHSISVYKKL